MTWAAKAREKLTIRGPRDLLRIIGYTILLFMALVFGPLIILALIVLGGKALLFVIRFPNARHMVSSTAEQVGDAAERELGQ